MPWRDGLITAGRQATIPETAMWQAQDTTAELDGLLAKRPGLRQWGQTIKTPDPKATGSGLTSFVNFLSGTGGFIVTDGSSGKITSSTSEGALRTNVELSAGTEDFLAAYADTGMSGNEWSLRFMFSGTRLPTYDDTTVAKTFAVRGIAGAGTGREFAIFVDGIYYRRSSDSKFTLISDTEVAGLGGWNVIELRVDTAGNTTVYVNEVLKATISSGLATVAVTAGSPYEFYWRVDPATQYSTNIATVMYNDTITDPFMGQEIVALKNFQYTTTAGSNKRALLCAAGGYIYHDNGLFKAWRPLLAKQYSSVFFTPYRQTMLWSDNNGAKLASIWQWNGFDEPELLDDAPRVRLMAEHQQRVFAAGDRENPLRVYYSGDRQPNLWFSPGPDNVELEYDTVLNAGYVTIPGREGDEVTALFGDYYGIALAFTRTGVWRIDGSGPTSYSRNALNQDVGCENPNAVDQVGNDIWFISRQGVHSLSATDKFGNIQTNFPSAGIQNLWSQNPSSVVTISREYLSNAKLSYNPTQSLVYVALPLTGDVAAENVMVYNTATKQWYGPWQIDNRAMENVEVATPVIEVMMHGDVQGRVGHNDPSFKRDFTDGSVDMKVESAYLNGRSIDPVLVGMMKTWKRLRLYVLPRGDWDFQLTWRVDAQDDEGPEDFTQNLFPSDTFFLGSTDLTLDTGDMRLDLSPDGILRSREEMGIIEIPLDVRGYALAFVIEQAAAGEDFVIQGYEAEFIADGYETEAT
jgi:hypothetical protein